jgi:hypothetical protein
MINSTTNLEDVLKTYYPTLDLSVNMQGLSGDVRFRCRYYKDRLDCFAFRCEEPNPAACKRIWWVRHKYSYDGRFFGLDFKRFNISGNFTGCVVSSPSQPICDP